MIILNKVNLKPREESKGDWEAHKEINAEIAANFQNSLTDLTDWYYGDIAPVTDERILSVKEYGNIPLGPNTTLGKSGCAVFCLAHALAAQGKGVEIAAQAKEVYDKGYYCEVYEKGCYKEGKGTYHNLFDLHKNGFAIRARSYRQVFDTLISGHIVTALVDNVMYNKDMERSGSHYINIVGKTVTSFLIEDSNYDERIERNCMQVFKSCKVVWLWVWPNQKKVANAFCKTSDLSEVLFFVE